MKKVIRENSIPIIIGLVTLLLILSLMYVVDGYVINDLRGELQTTEIELEKAEETLEDYEFYLWVLNMQRGDAMRAYEEERVKE